jgi:carboxymethylenebutenolidase
MSCPSPSIRCGNRRYAAECDLASFDGRLSPMGTTQQLTAEDGHRFSAYLASPAGPPRGAVVVVQEIFGVNSHIRAVADGYAQDGYLAVAPALFDRIERGVEIGYTPEDVARGRQLKGAADIDAALRDVAAAIGVVARAGKVGIVGYCWGGFVSWMASARVDGLACAVVYYGGGVIEHADLEPRCPVLGHFGERDPMIPVAGVRELAARHPGQAIHVYPADHGFNCDQRGSYDASAAREARQRTLAFFHRHIG